MRCRGAIFCAVLAILITRDAIADGPPDLAAQNALESSPNTTFRFDGRLGEYLRAITDNWLLRAPDDNPAMLGMFADRDRPPYRDLLPWSGEFAGKYLTSATQVLRI